MRGLSAIALSLFTDLGLISFSAVQGTSYTESPVAAQRKAEDLWEQAIAAKGGRERLYGVHNFVVSSRTSYGWNPVADVAPGISENNLYVLPDKWWSFWDYRPGKMGYGIDVLNFEREIRWHAAPGRPVPSTPRPDVERDVMNDFKHRFRQAQIIYLMETKWMKPTLVKARTASVGFFKKVDVIEAIVGGARVDFHLDRETHLPVKIVTSATPAALARGEMDYTVRLDDYVDVNGIIMPQKVEDGGTDNQTTYQINVRYNEEIFERPPTPDIGPKSWQISIK